MLHPDTLSAWTDQKGREHAGKVCDTKGEFKVIECACCEFKHVIPLPTAEELETVYSKEYYTTEIPFYIDRHLEDRDWWNAIYTDRYEVLEHHVPNHNRSILDIGSGPGLFLDLGKKRGWKVLGIEPSTKAAEYSREILGLEIINDFLNSNTVSSLGKFHAINMGEVLEHLSDPTEMLGFARDLLHNNGILNLVVPNEYNPFQMVIHDHARLDPWWVAPPHHLNYFSHASLKKLVERLGFEVVGIESTFPIDIFLLMGKNYIGNDILGREVHGLRKNLDLNLLQGKASLLRRKLYSAFAEIGIGREIVIYARKIG